MPFRLKRVLIKSRTIVDEIGGKSQLTAKSYRGHAMKKKVFIVDDDPGIVEMVEFELKVYGYDVSTASSGKEV
jgi:PleD family two-component response regulator